jgi:hypothetical protein
LRYAQIAVHLPMLADETYVMSSLHKHAIPCYDPATAASPLDASI